jgi:hypothetical protein
MIVFIHDPMNYLWVIFLVGSLAVFGAVRFKWIGQKFSTTRAIVGLATTSVLTLVFLAAFLGEIIWYPVARVAISPEGMWCSSWGFWVAWQEVNGVSETYGRRLKRTVQVGLRTEYLDRHPWSPITAAHQTATCYIDGLDHSTGEVYTAIRDAYVGSLK